MEKQLTTCIHCGIGKMNVKAVEKVLSSNGNTALAKVEAEVRDYCGELYYFPETIRYFEKIKIANN